MHLETLGSLSSMAGLLVSLYVLWREIRIQKDVTVLKDEEENWHKENKNG